jgi:phosphoribosylaminoimidazole-succinocarboxamide synthase
MKYVHYAHSTNAELTMPSQNVSVITETQFPTLTLKHRGKVRDLYEVDEKLLLVATDRISAYDVVMKQGIPLKGKVLTKISEFWFEELHSIVPNHLLSTIVYDFPSSTKSYWSVLEDRTMLVKKTKPLPVECVVRGYLSGSGWVEYQQSQSVCGVKLPAGLVESSKLPEPIFTPATKEEQGKHDENISFQTVVEIVGETTARKIRDYSLAIYTHAAKIAEAKEIIIADTKLEFGHDEEGRLLLIDEVLTPDSSRFWPRESYQPGKGQASYDKQFVRDYLLSINFNKRPPAPTMPEEIIFKTSALYLKAYEQLTGKTLI